MTVQLLREAGQARLRFDRSDKPVNLMDGATMASLAMLLDQLEADPPAVLVVESGKPNCFVAGADVAAIEAVTDADTAAALAQQGQAICHRLQQLPSISIAVVSGACMGGGLELALACDRILTVERASTKLALPEVKIGIHPGFGGCVRLPGRVGWPQAVRMIASGASCDGKRAMRIGLADLCCRPGQEQAAISRLTQQGKRPSAVTTPWWFALWPALRIFFHLANRKLRQRFPHLDLEASYPALPALLQLLQEIYGMSEGLALAREAESLGKLAYSDSSKHLIRAFFLGNGLKKHTAPAMAGDRHCAVYGGGVMGHGIAWVASRSGSVDLHEVAAEPLAKALSTLAKFDRTGGKRLAKIRPTLRDDGLHRAGVVIEAVLESLAVKQDLWQRIEPLVAEDALLLSNTSALAISDQQQGLAHPGRLAGLHFFNPAPKMPLVEVIAGKQTSPETIERVKQLAVRWGKFPVVVADAPGFLVNRCLMPLMAAAFRLLQAGQTAPHIDGALKCYGMPMGALELADTVGLDICHHVGKQLSDAFGARMAIPDWFARMVDDGLLGKKGKSGFYDWGGKQPVANPAACAYWDGAPAIDHEFDANLTDGRAAMAADQVVLACLLPMLIEALRCLEEKVVADADQLDAAMIYGIGYPAFRGGLLHDFAHHHRLEDLQQAAQRLNFDGAELLTTLA
ncbi:MAG: 3-hydroxyacyl-CoA dehydrogenase NAD-binding domain-containing protein [Mariprofundales bacterium]